MHTSCLSMHGAGAGPAEMHTMNTAHAMPSQLLQRSGARHPPARLCRAAPPHQPAAPGLLRAAGRLPPRGRLSGHRPAAAAAARRGRWPGRCGIGTCTDQGGEVARNLRSCSGRWQKPSWKHTCAGLRDAVCAPCTTCKLFCLGPSQPEPGIATHCRPSTMAPGCMKPPSAR